jgi:hypothetical protein
VLTLVQEVPTDRYDLLAGASTLAQNRGLAAKRAHLHPPEADLGGRGVQDPDAVAHAFIVDCAKRDPDRRDSFVADETKGHSRSKGSVGTGAFQDVACFVGPRSRICRVG